MERQIHKDLNNITILHNSSFEWGDVIEGIIHNESFKVSVDSEGIPFDIRTNFEDQDRLLAILNFMGYVWYQVV